MKVVAITAAAVLSGVLLYGSFPPLDIAGVVWVGLVPLFVAINAVRYRWAFFIGLVMGVVLCGLHARWLAVVPGMPVIAFLLIVAYGATYFGVFSALFLMVARRIGWPKILVAPVIWVAVEFGRSNLSFLAIPWALLGYSQHANLPIIQIASIGSVYGISFLVMLVNVAIADALLWLIHQRICPTRHRISRKAAAVSLAVAVVSVAGIYLWGDHQVRVLGRNTNTLLTASLIQGNIPQQAKEDPGSRSMIMERYRNLTVEASREKSDLIIWPETATVGYLSSDPVTSRAVKDLIGEIGIPLLLGSASNEKINRKEYKGSRLKNSAFLIDTNGEVLSTYHKMRLLPFGEYLPLAGRFSWPRWLVPENGRFTPGTSPTVFDFGGKRFGVVICWENLFPGLFRTFVQGGAQFMVNLTNEAWFGKTAASHQIMAMSVFRAVENRVALLRSANTGVSGLIDPIGRVLGRITDNEGQDIMVAGILTVAIPEPVGSTFYTRHGDVFAITCVTMTFVLIIMSALPVGTRRRFAIFDS